MYIKEKFKLKVDIFDTFEKCTITKRLTKQFEDKKEQN
jgi:hypothetical protein